jgi:hypothetical protein
MNHHRIARLLGAGTAVLAAVTCGGGQVAAPTAPTLPGAPVGALRQTTGDGIVMTDFQIRPRELYGGERTTGTATLSGPAPEGGVVVTLAATKREARIPETFTVPAGHTTGSVGFWTGDVSHDMEVLIAATAGGHTRSVQIRLWPKTRGAPAAPAAPSVTTGSITLGASIN